MNGYDRRKKRLKEINDSRITSGRIAPIGPGYIGSIGSLARPNAAHITYASEGKRELKSTGRDDDGDVLVLRPMAAGS